MYRISVTINIVVVAFSSCFSCKSRKPEIKIKSVNVPLRESKT